ncbi:MAG: ABC transporter substrate-binding protein [Candidatus Omnitrophica bacterium]|nr:ABC transporter substrate-binding protein [Candidatus Omnitrophota bacterium]
MKKRLIVLLVIPLLIYIGSLAPILRGGLGIRQIFPESEYEIRIGCSSLTPLHCMFGEVFNHTDILARHNLRGNIIFFEHGKDQAESCGKNMVDITFSCEIPAILHMARCPGLRIIGTPGALGRIALIVPEGSSILTPEDLRGKDIMIHDGSSAAMAIDRWLKDAGIDPRNDVKLIYSDMDGVVKRLSSGEGDAVVSWDPWLEIFVKDYDMRILKQRLFYSAIVASDRFLRKYPKAAELYVTALEEALLWSSNNIDDVSGWISARSGIDKMAVEKVMLLNENFILRESEKEINFGMTEEAMKILDECNDFLVYQRSIPADFNIRSKIYSLLPAK